MAKSLVKDSWVPEIALCLLSGASFFCIVGLLFYHNQKRLFIFYGVSLNAIVSALSAVLQASLLYVVASCLGQWKYVSLFRGNKRRYLADFSALDDASRGSTGSLVLLWRTRFASLAAIGALVTILGLFVDPFLQQVITFEEQQSQALRNATTIPRAVSYSKGNEGSFDLSQFFGPDLPEKVQTILKDIDLGTELASDFSMQGAILSGISDLTNATSQKISVRCPSASCFWEPYDSIAICSECKNITEKIEKRMLEGGGFIQVFAYTLAALGINTGDFLRNISGPAENYTEFLLAKDIEVVQLPNDLYIQTGKSNFSGLNPTLGSDPANGDRVVNMTTFGTSDRTQSIAFQDDDLLLWSLTVLKRSEQPVSSFTATECALSYCMNRITSYYKNGTLYESMERLPMSESNTAEALGNGKFDKRPSLSFGGNYRIAQRSIKGISEYLSQVFNLNGSALLQGATGIYTASLSAQSDEPLYKPDSMQHIFESTNLSATFESLARSMTNNLRMNDNNNTLVQGTSSITVYKVRWLWILLPALGLLGGIIFLGIVFFFTRKTGAPLWKSSTLPVLKVGGEMGEVLRETKFLSEMQEVSEKTDMGTLNMRIVRLASQQKAYEDLSNPPLIPSSRLSLDDASLPELRTRTPLPGYEEARTSSVISLMDEK